MFHTRSKSKARKNALIVPLLVLALVVSTGAIGRAAGASVLADNHPAQALTQPSLGNADPNQPLTMEIRFELRNTAELDQLLKDQQNPSSPTYHQWLKTGEFDRRFGPRPEHVK